MTYSEIIYKLNNITRSYPAGEVLNIDSFTINRNTSLGIVGPNGAGKSTLMRLLAFLDEPTTGTITFNNTIINQAETSQRRQVSYLMQTSHLLKRSVYENIVYGLKIRGIKHNLIEKAEKMLSMVNLNPSTFLYRSWNQLSGGESQRVALASRLILNPEVLILDEPTANVDSESAAIIRNVIESYRNTQGTTLIISSHDYHWLGSVTSGIIQMVEGRIAGEETVNLLRGPWVNRDKNLSIMDLGDGQMITASLAPEPGSIALLHPHEIILSKEKASNITAQNQLKGTIHSIQKTRKEGTLIVEVTLGALMIRSYVTSLAAQNLALIPGLSIWVIFKATSLLWHEVK